MTHFTLLPARDRIAQPWKNGGGVMWDVAIFPEGATTETFIWRLSVAKISTSRPFSPFPGVTRHFGLLTGDGVTLSIEGREPVSMTPIDDAISFSGDAKTEATLQGGPVLALNLMTRDRCMGSLSHFKTSSGVPHSDHPSDESIVIAGSAGLTVQLATEILALTAQDAFRFQCTELPRLTGVDAGHWLARIHAV